MKKSIAVDTDANVVLVDTSYFMLYRYTATLKWYRYKNSEINYNTLHNNAEFIDAFKRHILNDINKLKKKWKIPNSNLIFCLDVPRDTIWRHEIYPYYKTNRDRVVNPMFNSNVFAIFHEYLGTLNYTQLKCDHLEADDTIYLSTNELLKLHSHIQIIIITNDNDYLQLRKPNKIEIYNMNKVNLETRSCGDPQKDRLLKIIQGDVSDNIPKVCAKIGVKTIEKLVTMSEEELLKWFATKSAECVTNYIRNKKLISFEEIPEKFVHQFSSKYEFCKK